MLEFLKQKKIIIGIAAIAIIFGGIYIFDLNGDYNTIEENQEIMIKENSTKDESEETEEKELVIVHIAGCVKKPGIVRLPEGSRIEDAINAADGLNEDADISNINLAHVLEDGTKIRIPSINDENNNEEEDYIIDGTSSETSSNQSKGKLVNINTATASDLQTLDGIGPSLATRIVEYRNSNGKFKKIEDIKNVSGIGDSKYAKIKDYIKV